MKLDEAPLPNYSNPPLKEVAIAVQWENLDTFTLAHFGLLWQQYRKKFPQTRHLSEIDPKVETLGFPARRGQPQLRLLKEPPFPRVWFVDDGGGELIQVQRDRFVRNWRKTSSASIYPRYEEHIRPEFLRDYETFLDFIQEEDIGEVVPNQCELLYLNEIYLSCEEDNTSIKGRGNHGRTEAILEKIVAPLSPSPRLLYECAKLELSYLIPDEDDKFLGRLYVSVNPIRDVEPGTREYELRLTARGSPPTPDVEGVMKFMDLGREAIVKTFDTMLTSNLQVGFGRNS